MKTFLVGGAVRDMLMGIEAKDRDYVVLESSEDEMLAAGFDQVGMGFPVFLHPETGEEYALARREKKVGAGYTGFEFETDKSVTLREDLSRRDLTINSMAIDADGNLIDPFGGADDLSRRVLRHTSQAFLEDPLRVVRLARFYARYSKFSVDNLTMELAAQIVERGDLDELPTERFWLELEKVFTEVESRRFFELLFEVDGLQRVRFFQRLFGTDWSNGRLGRIMKMASSLSAIELNKQHRVQLFAVAVAPREPTMLASDAAKNAYNALKLVRALPKDFTAAHVHDVLHRVRGFSIENKTLSDLLIVMQVLNSAGEEFSLTPGELHDAVLAGRKITAAPFQSLTGAAIGQAVMEARVEAIAKALNLKTN